MCKNVQSRSKEISDLPKHQKSIAAAITNKLEIAIAGVPPATPLLLSPPGVAGGGMVDGLAPGDGLDPGDGAAYAVMSPGIPQSLGSSMAWVTLMFKLLRRDCSLNKLQRQGSSLVTASLRGSQQDDGGLVVAFR
nr:hypothetical protein Iba_chr15aCG0820 [Ipomoea batatas]